MILISIHILMGRDTHENASFLENGEDQGARASFWMDVCKYEPSLFYFALHYML